MGYPNRMAASLPNNINKNKGANVNQIQFGDKLQGLVSLTNRRLDVNRHVKTRCGGHLPNRTTIFCVNQLGGVGNVKNTQFVPNADGVKNCKQEIYDYKYEEKWELVLPRFSFNIKLDIDNNQASLLHYFETYQYLNIQEDYTVTDNTPFAIINLRQKDFNDGTLQIKVPGIYVLREDIVFHPNPHNNFMPTQEQMETGRYPSMRNGGAYHLGFFAAITIETDSVILDLNGKTIKQSREHNLLQRFYANIELANSPFILNQGPGKFTTETSYKAAENVLIKNGTLGKTSHHGIHGNKMKNIVIQNLVIQDFEVAGIALNGAINSVLLDIDIKNTTRDTPVLSSFSQAIFIMPLLKRIKNENASFSLGNNTIEQIITTLEEKITQTKLSLLSSAQNVSIPDIFRNNKRMLGYDGNVYGMVLNVNGIVINDFLQTRPDNAIGNKNIYVKNVRIENLVSNPIQIIGLSKAAEELLPPDALAYGGKRQVGPAGDVLDILKITDQDGKYNSNALSDAQLIVAKYANESNKKMGTTNILREVVDWAEGSGTIDDLLTGDLDLYYIKNGDSMGHLMKGSIGFFISGGQDINIKDLIIDKVVNKGKNEEFSEIKDKIGNNNTQYEGATSSGIVIAASKRINISNGIVKNIVSDNSRQYNPVRMIGDNEMVSFNNTSL